MKKIIILLLVIISLFSCNEAEMFIYNSGNYLTFNENAKKDSVDVSFFFHPGEDKLEIPLVFNLTGNLLLVEQEFTLSVDESSTATSEDYILPENLVFGKNKVSDTLYLCINKTDKLDLEKCKLILRIEDNNNFKAGFKDYSYKKIYFSNLVSIPKWWTSDIISYYLGGFSAEKYLLFCKVIGEADLEGVELSQIRQYSLTFKRYLENNPAYEKNGDLITVPVIG